MLLSWSYLILDPGNQIPIYRLERTFNLPRNLILDHSDCSDLTRDTETTVASHALSKHSSADDGNDVFDQAMAAGRQAGISHGAFRGAATTKLPN